MIDFFRKKVYYRKMYFCFIELLLVKSYQKLKTTENNIFIMVV